MANLKEVRIRIASVTSTQQITKAMKLVSATKLRRAQNAITLMRPYAAKLSGILSNLSYSMDVDSLKEYFFQQDVKRWEEERQMQQMRAQAYWDMADSTVNSFHMLYSAGGAHARKWFTLWKMSAIGEATVKGIQSVINSYEFGTKLGGPPMGATMAAVAALAVYAKLTALKKTEFGGGGGAVGTYSARSEEHTSELQSQR